MVIRTIGVVVDLWRLAAFMCRAPIVSGVVRPQVVIALVCGWDVWQTRFLSLRK